MLSPCGILEPYAHNFHICNTWLWTLPAQHCFSPPPTLSLASPPVSPTSSLHLRNYRHPCLFLPDQWSWRDEWPYSPDQKLSNSLLSAELLQEHPAVSLGTSLPQHKQHSYSDSPAGKLPWQDPAPTLHQLQDKLQRPLWKLCLHSPPKTHPPVAVGSWVVALQ